AGALFNVTISLAFLLAVVSGRGPMDRVVLVRLAQLNILTFAVYLFPWLSTADRWQPSLTHSGRRLADYLVKLQLALAITLIVILFLPVTTGLVLMPANVGIGTAVAGSLLGWLAFFALAGAVAWLAMRRTIVVSVTGIAAFLLGLSCLIAFSASGIDGWAGLHTLTVCTTVSAWLFLVLVDHDPLLPRLSAANVSLVGSFAAFLSL